MLVGRKCILLLARVVGLQRAILELSIYHTSEKCFLHSLIGYSSEVSSKYHSPLRVSFPTIFGYDCYDCLILVDLLRQVPQSTCNIKKIIIKPHFIYHNPPLSDPKLPQKLQGQLNFLTVMPN